MDAILTDVGIDGQQCMRVERMLVSRRYIEGHCFLPLVLAELIQRIRYLEPIPREEYIHVDRIRLVGLKVETVEERTIIADVMDRLEFRCVQEMA